jgi:hypothetical protein
VSTLKIDETQFRSICRDAKVRTVYSYVAGSAKQSPYVLLEWDSNASHVHVELQKLVGGRYYRVMGNPESGMIYEFEMTGFHVKCQEAVKVHSYMGFVLNSGGVWDPGWSKMQTETVTRRGRQNFSQASLGEEDKSLLMRIGRSLIKDLGTVTGVKQNLGQGFEGS